jgi:hypothetical protein
VANPRRARLDFHPIFQRQQGDFRLTLTGEYKPTEERTLPAAIHFAIAPEAVASAATAVARANSRVRHQGNISSSYERIYHVPGQRYYDKTQMNEGKGERWFCSEQEAVGAGWRKAKVYAAAVRIWLGAFPVHRLNVCVNALTSLKPSSQAILDTCSLRSPR